MIYTRWWKYCVLRGDGIPAELDGMWFDFDQMPPHLDGSVIKNARKFDPTNMWEQRADGEVAVVYKMINLV